VTVVPGSSLRFEPLAGRRSADPFGDGLRTSSVRVVEMERTEGRTAHRHPHSDEIVYVESGSGHLWLQGERLPVAAGDLVRVPAGVAHATVPEPATTMRLVCFFPHPDLTDNIEDTDIIVS
jgi:quercetin dioxygenase-like cupin family protein